MLYRRSNVWHYDFTVAGRRQRGTTNEVSESRARRVESKLIAKAEQTGPSVVLRRAPLLLEFGPRFMSWVDESRGLAPKTRRYYRIGWARIKETPLMGMTLRRLLGKAMEWKVIAAAPRIKLLKELGREQTIDLEAEGKLLAVAKQPMKDVLIIIQDTGMRPEEVFRIQLENIDWSRRVIFNPHGKTRASRRRVPISERMSDLLMLRCRDRREGWLFPSRRAADGHLTTVAKQFREARSETGLPRSLVLYCARHTFGTAAYEATGNLAMVMKVMGHTDVRTSMRYQHPVLDSIREAIDLRNSRHNPRHSDLRVQ